MAHRCSHPSKQFIHSEWFGQVIVGAEIERLNLTGLVAATGQNDNRYTVVASPNHSQQVMALDIRQAEIENDQGWILRQQFERDRAIGGFEDLVALCAKSHAEKLADRLLVVNNKH